MISLARGLRGDAAERERAAVAAIGSFDMTYHVMAVDNDTRRAVVFFEATNVWDLKSATKAPVGDDAGNSAVKGGPSSGPTSPVHQAWYWTEVMTF